MIGFHINTVYIFTKQLNNLHFCTIRFQCAVWELFTKSDDIKIRHFAAHLLLLKDFSSRMLAANIRLLTERLHMSGFFVSWFHAIVEKFK